MRNSHVLYYQKQFKISYLKILMALCIIMTSPIITNAQLNATVFEEFSQSNLNSAIYNPSPTDTSYLFKFQLDNITELGIFNNIGRFYLDVDKKLGLSKLNDNHYLGVSVYNSKQGDFINRSRFHVRYGHENKIGSKTYLSTGATFGFVNYSFLTSQGGTGGSDFAPDGSIGFSIKHKNTSIGFAVQQIFNAVIIPVNQSFPLDRLYNINANRDFNISQQVSSSTSLVYQIKSTSASTFSLNQSILFHKLIYVAANYHSFNKISLNAGIKKFRIYTHHIDLILSYTSYRGDLKLKDNAFEFYISLTK